MLPDHTLSARLRDTPLLSAATTLGHPERPRLPWILTEAEARACASLTVETLGGGRGATRRILDRLPALRDEGLEGLARYLDVKAARQQLNRLILFNAGQLLVRELERSLEAAEDGAAIWSSLRKEVRAVVRRPMPERSRTTPDSESA
ncbi:MAG: hypothetical protein H6739_33620 [Alphaproteobacteria bacterium]|nr:hypothetical protein [Alphaproteobacteria bacterium]